MTTLYMGSSNWIRWLIKYTKQKMGARMVKCGWEMRAVLQGVKERIWGHYDQIKMFPILIELTNIFIKK